MLDRLHPRLAALLTASQATSALTPVMEARVLRRSTTDHIARQERRARRLARDQEVRALQAQGVSPRHMALRPHMRRTPVIRSRRAEAFPERAPSWRGSLLDPSVASRRKRWATGCHHGVSRWRDRQALGCPGTRRMVSTGGVRRRELARGSPSASGRRPALPQEPAVRLLPAAVAGLAHPLAAPRQLVWRL